MSLCAASGATSRESSTTCFLLLPSLGLEIYTQKISGTKTVPLGHLSHRLVVRKTVPNQASVVLVPFFLWAYKKAAFGRLWKWVLFIYLFFSAPGLLLIFFSEYSVGLPPPPKSAQLNNSHFIRNIGQIDPFFTAHSTSFAGSAPYYKGVSHCMCSKCWRSLKKECDFVLYF